MFKQFTKCIGPNSYDKGDLEAVRKRIQQVLGHNQAVSMNILHALYGLQPSDTRYRHVLKNGCNTTFPINYSFFPLSQIPQK